MKDLFRYLVVGVLLGATGVCVASPRCQVTIHSDDRIHWDTPDIKVSNVCENFTVTLVHDGQLSKDVMGHNWVLAKTEDSEALLRILIAEKDNDYINEDPRIIAHTKLLGGGQVSVVTFDVSKLQLGQAYSFFCSYPEHVKLMQGTLELIED